MLKIYVFNICIQFNISVDMKIKILLLITLISTSFVLAQNKTFWQRQSIDNTTRIKASKQNLPKTHTFSLNVEGLKQALVNVPKRGKYTKASNVIVAFPNEDGTFESFRIVEASVLSPELQERYPDIKSYAGHGVEDPSAVIRFSISPLGFQSMKLSANTPATFIEALTKNGSHYAVFKRADKINYNDDFECSVTEGVNSQLNNVMQERNADDAILRTYRLAVSTTGEYTVYHGGTKALALAAINQTMTRVNGVFENDFNVTMVLISNNDDVIYTNPNSDPYSNGSYNSQLQSTLTSVVGESNYDIGHLFAQASNNGNAGCIGCVCVNGQKGSGFTSRTDPEGDPFDIDYVAHEMGHQFGGNHTWTFNGNEGTNAQMEPGSGSTIMGYAGITGATDVQSNSDPYFHARSIEQVTDYIKTTSCQTNTNTGNAVPSADAGSNHTIPNGTAFVLEGSGSDSDAGDVLTYCWEQYDENNASTTYPSVTATTGVAFRSYSPTTSTDRYFPRLSTIKTGATSWQWEAVPNVARSLNFRLTVRDNRLGGANNNSDDMQITVNGAAGPFLVNSPNTNVSWSAGTTQTITWDVAGTTGNGVNTANVDIFLSTDGGDTYPISLASGVANDGSHDIIVPNSQGTQNRVMVRGAGNIFFDISNSDFTIAGEVVCNAAVPTSLAASNIGETTATLGWDAVPGATYDLRYREVGAPTWITNAVTGISSNISGLTTLTQYEAQVRSKCSGGSNSAYTTSVVFMTTDVQLDYCDSASTDTDDEFISRVQLNTIDNTSGAQFYSDFTNISTTLTKGTQYTITVTPTWTGQVYSEGYSVWIDYNRDGDFEDAGEQVWTQAATTNSPVSGSFTIPTGAVENSTRMRVSLKFNGIPTECETFQYGEVEDYTVIIESSDPDVEAPSVPNNLIANGTMQTTTDLSWDASTDNIGVTEYDIYQDGILVATVPSIMYQVTGLTPLTSYDFYVIAKDAAGNSSPQSNTVTIITLEPDTEIPTTPLNLLATNITDSTVDLAWETSTDNSGVISYDIYQDGVFVINISTTTYQVVGLTAETVYTFKVKAKDFVGNESEDSNEVSILTLSSDLIYCVSESTDTSDEYISRVQLNTIDNASGPTFYSDFTAISTTLRKGTQYTISITPTWPGTLYNEGYGVWIDYNNDGDFEDAGEDVFTNAASQDTPVSGDFTIPLSASETDLRMRVTLRYNQIPGPCDSFTYGEVEDYTVKIIGSGDLIYSNSAWTPYAPSPTTGVDNAIVLDGTYNLTGDIQLNNISVNEGASMVVEKGQSLTLNGDLISNDNVILESDSNEYASLIVTNNVVGNVQYKRYVNSTVGGNDLISPPVFGEPFDVFQVANSNIVSNTENTSFLFGPFDKITDTYLLYSDTETTPLYASKGYRAASTNASTFTFTGLVNTRAVSAPIVISGPTKPEWNLIGNPYPSYIKLADFLSANNAKFDMQRSGIYGYDGDASSGWTILNQAYSDAHPNAKITPGQGFLIASGASQAQINFTPIMRATGSDDDFILGRQGNNVPISHLKLKLDNTSNSYDTDFYFTENASLGLDPNYDSGLFGGVSTFVMYSQLVEDNIGRNYGIQSIGSTNLSNVTIPLGIHISEGQQATISITETTLPENVEVYLEDNLTNTFTLLNTSDYVFTANTNLSGIGRFFLHFTESTLGTNIYDSNNIKIFTTTEAKVIFVKGQLFEDTALTIFDIQGRVLKTMTLDGYQTLNRIDVSSFSKGVYIVNLKNGMQERAEKVIVK